MRLKKTKRILIASVGNILKSDDGLGSNVIDQLSKQKLPDNIDTLSLDTLGLSILEYVRGYDKVIFIDIIKRGGRPGSIYMVRPQDIASMKKPIDPQDLAVMSMHEIDLEKAIAIGEALGEMPSDIMIIGCEPEDVDTIRIGLTNKVKEAIPKIIELLLEELNDQKDKESGA